METNRPADVPNETLATLLNVLEGAADGFLACDSSSHILALNSAAEKLCGRSRTELLGSRPWGSLFEPGAAALEREIERAIADRSPGALDCYHEKTRRWLELRVLPAAWGVALWLRDVTERKLLNADEDLRVAERLDSFSKLVGIIGHDFNNLLTVINGYGDMLMRDLEGDPDSSEAAVEIRMAGERAVELARQLVTFSREPVRDFQPLDLNRLIDEDLETLQRLVGKGIRIITKLGTPIDKIIGDSVQVHQLLTNLAMHAREAMPRGGILTIETSQPAVDAGPRPNVVLSIADGRPAAEAKSDRKGRIAGMALATAYSTVRQLGGAISFAMEPGAGAKVVIHLALAETDAKPGTPEAQPRPQGPATGQVLVVHDDSALRNYYRKVLLEAGFVVGVAEDGEQGLKLMRAQPFALVLTDLPMPNRQGLDVIRRIHQEQPELKIIALSQAIGGAFLEMARLSGVARTLSKTVTAEELVSAVRGALE